MSGVTIMTALVIAVLYAMGVYLMLQRTLTRIVLGLAMMGHGANLLLLAAGGPPGAPPLIGDGPPPEPFVDPLPQALALTAIVISFGVVSFLLALAYRSWTITHDDEVEDDIEDRRIAGRLEQPEAGGAGPDGERERAVRGERR